MNEDSKGSWLDPLATIVCWVIVLSGVYFLLKFLWEQRWSRRFLLTLSALSALAHFAGSIYAGVIGVQTEGAGIGVAWGASVFFGGYILVLVGVVVWLILDWVFKESPKEAGGTHYHDNRQIHIHQRRPEYRDYPH